MKKETKRSLKTHGLIALSLPIMIVWVFLLMAFIPCCMYVVSKIINGLWYQVIPSLVR